MATVLILGTLAQAEIAISSFTASPSPVAPGDEILLELLVENAGDDNIEDVIVSLDLTQVPFAPLGSSTEKSVDEIPDHRRELLLFTLKALPSAAPLVYKIPVIMTYKGISRTTFISVEVAATPRLEILPGDSGVVQVQDQATITLKFVNSGLSEVRFLKVSMPLSPLYEIISPASVYIGDVDVGDFETEEFTIIPRTTDPILTTYLEYRDAANHQFRETKLVQLSVYSPEEATALGLDEPRSMVVPLIIGVIVLVSAFLAYKKVTRRRKHES